MRICAFADEASNELQGQIEALKRNNMGLLEIRGVDGQNIKEISYEKINEIKKILDENGIKVWSIGSPVGKYKTDDNFEGQLEEFKKLCDFAHILGAKRIRMFSFFSKNQDEVFKNLQAFCDVCPDDIIMCHENEKGIFGDDIDGCLKILQHFDKIKMVFDPANFIQCGVDTLEAWEKLHKYVDYMHIKDALEDKRVVPAGCGIGNIEKLIKMYKAQGGEVLTLEPHLAVFEGLKQLENGESIKDEHAYPDNNTAFDAGANALKDILNKLNLNY